MATLESLQKKRELLEEQLKAVKDKEKQKLKIQQQKETAKKRKVETRVKIILGASLLNSGTEVELEQFIGRLSGKDKNFIYDNIGFFRNTEKVDNEQATNKQATNEHGTNESE